MADEHVTPDLESEAPAQEAVETPEPETWEPERAMSTIKHLRSREKELEQQLKSDEWFQSELERRGYQIAEDDDEEPEPEYDYDDDPTDQRLSAVEAELRERQEREALAEQSSHIDQLAEQYDVNLTPNMKRWVSLESISNGFTKKATEDAVKALSEDLDQFGKSAVEKYLKSKRAPSPPGAGAAGQPSGDFDPKDDKSRKERMAAIFASRDAA